MTLPTEPARRPRHTPAGGGLRGALIGAAVGVVLALAGWGLIRAAHADAARAVMAALRREFGPLTSAAVIGLAALVSWLVIGWHELGHLIAGAAARLRFRIFLLGPLRVERDVLTGRIAIRLNRELGTWGGMAGSFPPDAHDLRRRVAILLAGGPAASFLLAAAALIALYVGRHDALATATLVATALISAGIGAVTLLPVRGTDGGRLLRLVRGGPAAEREAAVFGMMGLSAGGTRTREWPPELAAAAVGAPDDSTEDAFATLLTYFYALDARDYPHAQRLIDRVTVLRDALPPALQPTATLEQAFVEAHLRRNPARARELLATIPARGANIAPGNRARVDAAIAFAEGDAERGRALMRQAIADAPPALPHARAELEELLAEMEASRGATPAS